MQFSVGYNSLELASNLGARLVTNIVALELESLFSYGSGTSNRPQIMLAMM